MALDNTNNRAKTVLAHTEKERYPASFIALDGPIRQVFQIRRKYFPALLWFAPKLAKLGLLR